jgi:hypothetical protein
MAGPGETLGSKQPPVIVTLVLIHMSSKCSKSTLSHHWKWWVHVLVRVVGLPQGVFSGFSHYLGLILN